MGRIKQYTILLSEEEKDLLCKAINKKDSCKTTIRRCGILLQLNGDVKNPLTQIQIANSFGVSKSTVSNVVRSYVDGGIDAILHIKRNPNSNAKLKMDGRLEAELIRIACGPAPDGRSKWTLRLLETQARIQLDVWIGKSTIQRVLKKTSCSLTETTTGASHPRKTPLS